MAGQKLKDFEYMINEKGELRCIFATYNEWQHLADKPNKPAVGKDGFVYHRLWDRASGKQKHRELHRLLAQTYIPNPDNKKFVVHLDKNKLNNELSNLAWSHRYDSLA